GKPNPIVPEEERDWFRHALDEVRAGRPCRAVELERRRKDGSTVWIRLTNAPIPGPGGEVEGAIAVAEDITEAVNDRHRLERLQRVLRARASLASAAARAEDEREVFEAVCRAAVMEAGYRMAWIGLARDDTARTVQPVAWAGVEEGYLDRVRITWDTSETGAGPTGTAIRTARPVACQNILEDPRFAPWRSDALERGYRSSAALPIPGNDRVAGALNLYAPEPDAFDDQELTSLIGLVDDLSAAVSAAKVRRVRREAEESLRLLTRALEASANTVVITDRDGTIQWANPAFTELTGYEIEEALGQNPRILKSGRHPDSFYKEMWDTILAGRVWHSELVNRRKDGTLYTEEMTITPVTDESGEITHFIAVKQDVSERKKIEKALQESEERFRSLYENMTIGLYQTTPDGRILMTNPALVKMLGYGSFEELATRNLQEDGFEPEHPRSRFIERIEREGEVRGLISAWRRRDGSVVWVRESARAVRDSEGKTLFYEGTVEDITERKRAEEALRESEERYRDLVDHSHELMSTQSLDGTILSANRATEEAFGRPVREIVGRNISDFLVPKYRDQFPAYLRAIRERGEASGLMRIRKPSGEERLLEYRNSLRSEGVSEPVVRGLA
ncbi:MAG TPA: PAS domain S-box protein, partial [Acidobacteria bacterium]|nr:PAS domain S-box protein [Acidobacteriota bacterium]